MMPATSLDRRTLLRLLGGAAGAALLPSPVPGWAVPLSSSQRVVVIGSGLAGLTAAYELIRHGHRVVVLEARPHAGGRVLTLWRPFDDKLHAEAGGEWIDPRHHYIRHYVDELGLELEQDGETAALLTDSGLHSLEAVEEGTPGYSQLRQALDAHGKDINIFERPDRSALAQLDEMSYTDFLRSLGASEAAIAYERIFVNTEMTVEPDEISALHMLYEFGLSHPEAVQSRIRGGNGLLIEAFARRLGSHLRLGAAATGIRWEGRGVRVHYRQRNEERAEEADHVIIAIPGTEVRNLRFDPPLPAEVARAYSRLGYGRVMKVVLQMRERFWAKTQPAYQWVFTPQEANHVYDSSWGQPGPRGLLTFYVAAWGADRWGALTAGERATAAGKLVREIWPGASAETERHASWFWNVQRWIRGSYAYFAPGEMRSVRPLIAQPVEHLHFAGEHTAVWQGYMNGAVESGLRAAAEVEPSVHNLFQELTQRSRSALRAVAEPVAA